MNNIIILWSHAILNSFPLQYLYTETVRSYLRLVPKEQKKESLSHIMLGLPFYGYDSSNAVVGSQYLESLQKYTVSIEYNTKAKEHVTK